MAVLSVATTLSLLSLPAFADTASGQVQNVGVGLAGSTVSISTASSVSFEVVPSSGGSLGVGKAALSVSTNSDNGYKLYVSGVDYDSNNYTSLYYDGDKSITSNKILGLPSTTATSFSNTSLYGGNASSTYNHWGFAVPSDTTSGYAAASAYDAVITAGTTIDSTTINNLTWKGVSANYTKVKESTTAGTDNVDVYFGAYVDNSLMTGTYQNTIVYTAFVEGAGKAVVSPTTIANGETMIITLGYQGQAISASQVSLRLYDKDSDTTVGTCDNLNIVSGTGTSNLLKLTCTIAKDASATYGTKYDLLATINGVSGPSATLTYEAEDVFQFYTPMVNNAYMQDMTARACQEATSWDSTNSDATTYKLIDKRQITTDENGEPVYYSYLVRKLADGNCWMTQNLALHGGTTITSADSDVVDDYTLPDSVGASGNWNDNANTTGWVHDGKHVDNSVDTPTTAGNVDSTNNGNYYSFVVATAGLSPTVSSGDAPNSICPKGWKLPTSGASGQFQAVYNQYNDYTKFKAAWAAAYTTLCYNGACPNFFTKDVSFYWSSTIRSQEWAYNLHFSGDSSVIEATYSNLKSNGLSVRCVLAS